MSNTIGWGKGASNNSIGWGNVGTNGFGSIYNRSNSGETDLAGEANIFQDAAVAYSLRDLGLGAESVVRVRRDSDNAEQDFTATEITDGTLTSFCGANDGFVSVWYDQKGQFNFIQPTASNQPQLVSLGNLNLLNGNPIIKAISASSTMYNISFNVQDFKSAVVTSASTITPVNLLADYLDRGNYIFFSDKNKTSTPLHNGGVITEERINGGLFNYTTRGDLFQEFENKQKLLSFTANLTFSLNGRALGYSPSDRALAMYDMQEMIIYPPTFTKILDTETNINDHYGIY